MKVLEVSKWAEIKEQEEEHPAPEETEIGNLCSKGTEKLHRRELADGLLPLWTLEKSLGII